MHIPCCRSLSWYGSRRRRCYCLLSCWPDYCWHCWARRTRCWRCPRRPRCSRRCSWPSRGWIPTTTQRWRPRRIGAVSSWYCWHCCCLMIHWTRTKIPCHCWNPIRRHCCCRSWNWTCLELSCSFLAGSPPSSWDRPSRIQPQRCWRSCPHHY